MTLRGIAGHSGAMRVVRKMPRPNRRLDSWKEIAAFFVRDERTVKRWEKERALPVHRLPGSSRARVFASTDELSQWMRSREPSTETAPPIEPSTVVAPNVGRSADLPENSSPDIPRRPWLVVGGLAVLMAIVFLGVAIAHRYRSTMIAPPATAGSLATTSSQEAKSPAAKPLNPETQELYLKGRYYWDKRTPDDLNKAVDFFTQTIARDPNYAPAYVGLADCYNLLREYAAMPPEEAYPRALAAAKKAVELDDSSAEAHNSLAFATFYWNWDAAGAEREFRRAIQLNPNYVTAHHWYATFLMVLGRFPEALWEIDRAQQLDPASTPILADKALILSHQGHTDQATTLLRQLEVAQPASFSTHQYLSDIYLANRDYANYLEQARKSAELSRDESQLAMLDAAEQGFKSGGRQRMLEHILGIQKKLDAEGRVPAFLVATTYGYLGNKAEALRYLEISERRHEASFISIRSHQAFYSLHDDPSFRNLVEQAGLPPLP